jgi:hypothetical protein
MVFTASAARSGCGLDVDAFVGGTGARGDEQATMNATRSERAAVRLGEA